MDEFLSHEIEDLDDLVDGVAFERHQYGHGVEEFNWPVVVGYFVADLVFVGVQLLWGEGWFEVLCQWK